MSAMLYPQMHRHQLAKFYITPITIKVHLQENHGSTDKAKSIHCTCKVYKKEATLNIHEYTLFLTTQKTFGPWNLRHVIVFELHNCLDKVGCANCINNMNFRILSVAFFDTPVVQFSNRISLNSLVCKHACLRAV